MNINRRIAQILTVSAAVALGTIAGRAPSWGEEASPAVEAATPEKSGDASPDAAAAKDANDIPAGVTGDEVAVEKPAAKAARPVKGKRIEQADSFIATADWEFDGFVAGGKDQTDRSIFYLNDLIFLNVGSRQGLVPGDRISIYKRGDRVRDPQTGRFLGYEVRRAAISEVTDKVDDTTSTARILTTFEAVEIGDLARREN